MSTSENCTQCTAKGFKARSMQCKIIVYFRELYTKYNQSTCKALYNYLLPGTVHKVQPKHLQSTVHKVQQYSLKHSQSTLGHCIQSTAKSLVKHCTIIYFRALYTAQKACTWSPATGSYRSTTTTENHSPLRSWSTTFPPQVSIYSLFYMSILYMSCIDICLSIYLSIAAH